MSALRPRLSYYVYDSDLPHRYTAGETPIHTVHEVSASIWRAGLRIHLRGPMLKKDGTRGRHERGTDVDLSVPQPGWLQEIIDDARRRLS